MNVEVVLCVVMPSAFDSALRGRPEQESRVRANTHAFFEELHAAQAGFFTRHNLTVGPDERNTKRLTAGMFNQLMLVGRYTADGRDLLTPQAVFDTFALHLAAEIGTEIADRIEMDEANEASIRNLAIDDATLLPRYASTIGASALTFLRDASHVIRCHVWFMVLSKNE